MNTLTTTHKQAAEKEAFVGALAKGVGKFFGAVPFWIGGSMLAEKAFGKKPKVTRKYIPRRQYLQLMRQQQAMSQQQQGGF